MSFCKLVFYTWEERPGGIDLLIELYAYVNGAHESVLTAYRKTEPIYRSRHTFDYRPADEDVVTSALDEWETETERWLQKQSRD